MNATGKAGMSGVAGAVIGFLVALAGGDTLEDIVARVKGEESNKVLALRLVKKLCVLPDAERHGELVGINEALAEDDQALHMPACDSEDLAEGPADADEVERVADELVEEVKADAEEAAAEVDAEIEQEKTE